MQASLNRAINKEQVQKDKLRLLYRQSFPAVFVSILASLIFTAVYWDLPNRDNLLIWLGLLTTSNILRMFLFLAYRKTWPTDEVILKWEKPYFITLLSSSLLWCIGAIILNIGQPEYYHIVTYYILIGMAGGALAVYSSFRYIAITVVLILMGPYTTWFFLYQKSDHVLLAIGGTIFILSTIRAVTILSNTLHDSFMLTYELTQAKHDAEELARTDMLTGLNNRRAFTEQCKQQLQYCQRNHEPVSMLVLDLDLFKDINDTHGHTAGDHALRHLSFVLQSTVRATDICGRTGGEEFAILLPNTDHDAALEVAEKIRYAIDSNPVHTPERTFHISASIGVTSDNYGLETLLQKADKAMYHSKLTGRNRVTAYSESLASHHPN